MIVLREAMGLVAHVLQQPQRVAVPAQPKRPVRPGREDQFLPLGQRR